MCHKTLIHILNPEYEIKLYDNKMCELFFNEITFKRNII